MRNVLERIEAVRSRQQRQWLWQALSMGLVAGGALGCLLAVIRWLGGESLTLPWIAAVVVAGPVTGLVCGWMMPRPLRDAAVAIDHRYQLKDRISTALSFLQQQSRSPMQQLQLDDAESHLVTIDPVRVAPYRAPRTCGWGIMLSLAALLLAFLSSPQGELEAAIVINEVVLRQASRVSEDLRELEEFNREQRDPEIEKLLEELSEIVNALEQPGVDPKEALAKLSEMEAALQEKQQQLAQPATEAVLQQIGEALSLAEPLQAAGEAVAQGDMEKAVKELEKLEKLEMPELDRQTERAVTEQLERAAQNCSEAALRQLREATSQIGSGLRQGDSSRFKEGAKGLAGECRKQGRRKKLVDLLRKQCQSLCECKSECESACKGNGQSNQKGGQQWGLAASGNEPGDQTGKLKVGPQMNVTGMESEEGEVGVETVSTPEQRQEASRRYRDQLDKYEQISESVLESEPIPLGHRQTIRRYFQMIRPQDAEMDSVLDEEKETSEK